MTYLADSLYLEKLFRKSQPNVKLAQEGSLLSSVETGVSEYIKSKWHPDRPYASVVAFLAPGIFATMTGTWIVPVLYELADALGFDWSSFFSSLGKTIGQLAEDITNSAIKPSVNEVALKAEQTFDQEFGQHFTKEPNPSKFLELGKKVFGGEVVPEQPISKTQTENLGIIKQAAAMGLLRSLITKLFRPIFRWLIPSAFRSLALATGAGAARGVLGLPGDPHKSDEDSTNSSTERAPINSLQMNPVASPELFETHANDTRSVWLENGNINNIKEYLWDWISDAFPQLESEKNQVLNAPSFIETENLFRNRNKMATGINVFTIPRPFQRKIDVVSYIINKYLKTRQTPNK